MLIANANKGAAANTAAKAIRRFMRFFSRWRAHRWAPNGECHPPPFDAKSGLAGVVYYFTQVLKIQPKPIPAKLGVAVVSVVAEGDLVTVLTVKPVTDAKDPSKSYTTTWFDTWRMKDGKADEHWDPATRN